MSIQTVSSGENSPSQCRGRPHKQTVRKKKRCLRLRFLAHCSGSKQRWGCKIFVLLLWYFLAMVWRGWHGLWDEASQQIQGCVVAVLGGDGADTCWLAGLVVLGCRCCGGGRWAVGGGGGGGGNYRREQHLGGIRIQLVAWLTAPACGMRDKRCGVLSRHTLRRSPVAVSIST